MFRVYFSVFCLVSRPQSSKFIFNNTTDPRTIFINNINVKNKNRAYVKINPEIANNTYKIHIIYI